MEKLDNAQMAMIFDIIKDGRGLGIIAALEKARKEFLLFLASDEAAEDDFVFHQWAIEAITSAIAIYREERGE